MRNRSNRNQSGYFALVVDWLWLVASRKGCINRQISTNQLTHTHIHWTKNCHPMWHAYKGNTNQAFVILVEDTTASHGPIRKAISSATTLPKIGVQSFNLWPQPQIPYANMADQSYANEWKLRSRRLPAPDRHWLRTNKQKICISIKHWDYNKVHVLLQERMKCTCSIEQTTTGRRMTWDALCICFNIWDRAHISSIDNY